MCFYARYSAWKSCLFATCDERIRGSFDNGIAVIMTIVHRITILYNNGSQVRSIVEYIIYDTDYGSRNNNTGDVVIYKRRITSYTCYNVGRIVVRNRGRNPYCTSTRGPLIS